MPNAVQIDINIPSEQFSVAEQMMSFMQGKDHVLPQRDRVAELVEENGLGQVLMKTGVALNHIDAAATLDAGEEMLCSTISVAVADGNAAKNQLIDLVSGTDLEDSLLIEISGAAPPSDNNGEPYKSIEVYYDVKDIPTAYASALDFRNAAMDVIEQALEAEQAGQWVGAESGQGEVNFGFDVTDFERAERIACAAVVNTPFDCIREITRFEQRDG